MQLVPESLENNGYTLIDRLDHKELVPFVQQYLFRLHYWPVIYLGFNILMLAIIGLLIGSSVSTQPGFNTNDALSKLALGFAFAFLLIPLHEYLHAIAYRLCGAKEVSYDANLKLMIFMAIAHRFVADAHEFRFVAIAPFAVISLLGFAALPFLQGYYIYTALGLIFTHATFCGGDFAMLAYLNFHKDKEVVTWDDKVNKVSWFYGKPKNF
ncbi:MAG: DUF3267 domain-containing protein [Lentimicrobium sp.]